jgi:periplasmic divalent cation tolerance protein
MEKAGDRIAVFMTCDKEEEARDIAAALLHARKAACVSIYPPGESYYWWKGSINFAREHLLIAKTTRSLLPDLIEVVRAHHSYEVPEIVALPIIDGSGDYLAWLDGELAHPPGCGRRHADEGNKQ